MNTTPRHGLPRRAAVHIVVALLAAAVLAGCASASPAAAPTAPGSGRTTAAAAAPPSGTAGGSTAGSASPSGASTPVALAIHRFTTHTLSFRYPSDWSVAPEVTPMGGGGHQRETAAIRDATGRAVLHVFVNWAPQDVGMNVTRAVLDTEPVPGLGSAAVRPGYYAFYAETIEGAGTVSYAMTITPGRPVDGTGQSRGGPSDALVQIGQNGSAYAVAADASPEIMQFASAGDARAWLASAEGQRLKTILLSLTVY